MGPKVKKWYCLGRTQTMLLFLGCLDFAANKNEKAFFY